MSKIPPAIEVHKLHKTYRMGKQKLEVLRGASLTVQSGEFVSIVGASGSGKSTLLHLAGLLDRPDQGKILLDGVDFSKLPRWKRNALRCKDVGFVFQFYHLFSELSVLQNALLPARVMTSSLRWLGMRGAKRKRAIELLERLGLKDRLKHRPRELSGGERQRVAIARALMNEPKILLADEPTGNLDSRTGAKIIEILKEFNRAGQTILMVTHDASVAAQTHRTLHLVDGKMGREA